MPNPSRSPWPALLCLWSVFALWALWSIPPLLPWLDEQVTLQEIQGLWLQEEAKPLASGLTTAGAATVPTSPTGAGRLMAMLYIYDVHPPLYYLGALGWAHLFGDSTPALRLFSLLTALLAGVTMVASAARAARAHAPVAASAASLLLVCAPTFLFALANMRSYSVAMLCVALALAALGRLWEPGERRVALWFGLAGLASGLAILSHYFATLVLAAPMLATAVRHGRNARAVGLSILLFLPCAGVAGLFLANQMGARPDQYHGFGPLWKEALSASTGLAGALADLPTRPWVLATAALVTLGGLILAWRWRRHMPATTPALLAACTYPLLLCALFAATDKTLGEGGTSRYHVLVLPAVAVLVASLLAHGTRAWRGAPVAALFAFAMAIPLAPHISAHVQPWAGHARLHPAITAMAQNPEDALIVLPTWTSHEGFALLAHLPPHLPVWVVDDPRDLEQALAVAGRKTHLWIIGLYAWTPPLGVDREVEARVTTGLGFLSHGNGLFSRPTPFLGPKTAHIGREPTQGRPSP